MVVADDLRPQPRAAVPSKRLVPAPHKAAPKLAARPASGGPAAASVAQASPMPTVNGNSSALVATAPHLPPAAAVQQMAARQSAIKAASAELSLVQRQSAEQLVELKAVRGQLA